MNLDPQLIVFAFALFLALMGVVIYDLYEKVVDCETTIKVLQTTVAGLVGKQFSERDNNSENVIEQIARPRSLWESFTITAPDAEALNKVFSTVKPELFSGSTLKLRSTQSKESTSKKITRRNIRKKNKRRNKRAR